MSHILIVEDEENLRFSIARSLARAGHKVAEAGNVREAKQVFANAPVDVLVTDVNLDGDDGIELVRTLRSDGFDGPIIVITAFGSIDNAVTAMKEGADEYLQKPISLEALSVIINRALKRRRQAGRLAAFQRLQRQQTRGQQLLGQHESWLKCLETARKVASLSSTIMDQGELATVLITGETGVGKGELARFMHENCGEPEAPFVHLNCAALPASLIESELFGHEKGAFTDAKQMRRGFFEMADGGTVFLDEIGEMPIELQAKLLSIVERGVFRRIGGVKEHQVKVRVIAASNQDLLVLAEKGKFRRDLFYRLSTVTINIPPLRDRGNDVIVIAETMLTQLGRKLGRGKMELGTAAQKALMSHTWPGNVRELQNALHRAVMLSDRDILEPADLGLRFQARRQSDTAEQSNNSLQFDFESGVHTVEEVEKTLIIQALKRTQGNVSQAARLIGMNRSSLRYRIERYHLEETVMELATQ